jgi:hypothetical protein
MPNAKSPEAERFEAYLERLGVAVGHADRREPLPGEGGEGKRFHPNS